MENMAFISRILIDFDPLVIVDLLLNISQNNPDRTCRSIYTRQITLNSDDHSKISTGKLKNLFNKILSFPGYLNEFLI